MSYRCLAAVFTVIAGVALAPVFAAAQSTNTSTPPRTAWGQPDLQAVWDFRSITPLQRPEELADQEFLTEEEAANLEQATIDRNERLLNRPARRTEVTESVDRGEDGAPGFYNNLWLDRGTTVVGTRRTSLVIDPPDGRIPALTPAAQERSAARAALSQRITEGPEDRSLSERCILRGNAGPPMTPGGYNNNVQLFQTPGYVVIFTEQIHDARIVPMDGRPHLPQHLRQWMGDSRGRWEGKTLVVETTNFSNKAYFRGAGEGMHLIERFTRADADTLNYEFTVSDPQSFTKPWTAQIPMRKSLDPIYEYACHEGNYSMESTLSGARAIESRVRARSR